MLCALDERVRDEAEVQLPVYIYQDDAESLLVAVEGEDWGKQIHDGQFKGATPAIFREAWDEAVRQCAVEGMTPADVLKEEHITPRFWLGDGEVTIYGAGGWSRYVVRSDGEIVLLSSYAGQPTIDRAVARGFTVTK